MIEYNKADPIEFGNALGGLVVAVQGDGIDAGDLAQLLKVVEKSASAMNEIKGVPAAAGLHTVSGISDTYGDYLLELAKAADAAEEGGDG